MQAREPQATEHEEALVKAFILPSKQERCLHLLADPKRRPKFTKELSHFRWFNPSFATPVLWKVDPWLPLWERHQQGTRHIYSLLKAKGAGQHCWVISQSSKTDAKKLELDEALTSPSDFIVSCVPGRLAYFKGEEEILLLERR
jgi:hypothetical protein